MKHDGPTERNDTTDKNAGDQIKIFKFYLTTQPPTPQNLPIRALERYPETKPPAPEIQLPKISPNIIQFFQRIKINTTRIDVIANELSRFILPIDLAKIYEYVLDKQESLQEFIMNGKNKRLAKEKTGLKRTLNIVRDPIDGQQVALILETKHKTADDQKDLSITAVDSKMKKITYAWRIDTEKPQKWVNLVIRKNFNENILEEVNSLKKAINSVYNEVGIAKIMNVIGQPVAEKLGHHLFQAYSPGEKFYKLSA